MTADRRDLYGLPEVWTTDKFHDMVGAAIAGHSKDSFYPILLSAVDATSAPSVMARSSLLPLPETITCAPCSLAI